MTFTLTDHRGKTLLMRDGKPFRYSSAELAHRAKRIFEALKDCMTVYRVTPPKPSSSTVRPTAR